MHSRALEVVILNKTAVAPKYGGEIRASGRPRTAIQPRLQKDRTRGLQYPAATAPCVSGG